MPELTYDHILLRYGELTTKGKNRKEFTRQLVNNIKRRLSGFPGLEYQMQYDGLFIKLNGEDYPSVKEALKSVFGYSFFAGTIKTGRDIEEIKEACLTIAKAGDYRTFKMTSRRNDKSYPIHSDELNRICATHILKNTELKVDVHNPDLTVYLVIKSDGAYIMSEKVNGPGGYPTGINGRALHMMSGGIDSPVAGYLTM